MPWKDIGEGDALDWRLSEVLGQVQGGLEGSFESPVILELQAQTEGDGFGYHVAHGPFRLKVKVPQGKTVYRMLPDRMVDHYDENLGEKEIWHEFNERVAADISEIAWKAAKVSSSKR